MRSWLINVLAVLVALLVIAVVWACLMVGAAGAWLWSKLSSCLNPASSSHG